MKLKGTKITWISHIQKETTPMKKYKFKDIHNYGEPYIYIHPYMQKAVKYLTDNIYDWVDYVIIFGSSTNPSCHVNSDIDVCLIGKPQEEFNSQALRDKEHAYDFVLLDTKENLKQKSDEDFCSVYRDIVEKGVVVYAKKHKLAG